MVPALICSKLLLPYSPQVWRGLQFTRHWFSLQVRGQDAAQKCFMSFKKNAIKPKDIWPFDKADVFSALITQYQGMTKADQGVFVQFGSKEGVRC